MSICPCPPTPSRTNWAEWFRFGGLLGPQNHALEKSFGAIQFLKNYSFFTQIKHSQFSTHFRSETFNRQNNSGIKFKITISVRQIFLIFLYLRYYFVLSTGPKLSYRLHSNFFSSNYCVVGLNEVLLFIASEQANPLHKPKREVILNVYTT